MRTFEKSLSATEPPATYHLLDRTCMRRQALIASEFESLLVIHYIKYVINVAAAYCYNPRKIGAKFSWWSQVKISFTW